MIRINLLSEGRRPVVARKAKAKAGGGPQDVSAYLLVGGVVLGLIVAGAWWWVLNGKVKAMEGKINAAKREVAELRPIIKEVNDFKAKKAELDRKINVIKDLSNAQKGPVRIMDEVSRAVPDLLWLEQMSVTGTTVEVRGKAFNTNAVATFVSSLDSVEEFQEPVVQDVVADRGGATFSFRINFGFKILKPAEDVAPDESGDELP
ncbi:MAG: hypothetical protein HC897_15680 [Thermoanaerobaculia bacterium]|nr:hypothetical protein [Thermoanaerobaculia bacterium]